METNTKGETWWWAEHRLSQGKTVVSDLNYKGFIADLTSLPRNICNFFLLKLVQNVIQKYCSDIVGKIN